MEFGAAIFFTDYSMGPVELGRALEERGFESLWAPEHSHIPLSRRSPFPQGGDLPKKYYDVMDPFVTLSAAAGATSTLKVGTGICLVVQRDPIHTAKQVATIDQISNGRFLFGIGAGWNAEEMADHGTEFNENGQGFTGHGTSFSAYQVRTPFVLRWPGRPPARRLLHSRRDALGAKAVRHAQARRVVGDRPVRVALGARAARHRLRRRVATPRPPPRLRRGDRASSRVPEDGGGSGPRPGNHSRDHLRRGGGCRPDPALS